MLVRCSDLQKIMQPITKFHLKTWNHLIQTSTKNGFFSESLRLYISMLKSGLHGNHLTFPFIAKACAKLRSIRDGRKIHCHTILLGLQSDVFVQTSLLDMYSKCSHLEESRQLFAEMPNRTLVSWNSMISAYSQQSCIVKAFGLLNEMRSLGVEPSSSTLVSLLSGCAGSGLGLFHGLSIHCYGIKVGFDSDLQFLNSVMSMYVQFDLIGAAHSLFDSMEDRSTVTWTAIIGGYLRNGNCSRVFELFNEMHRSGIDVDDITFVSLISSCALLGRLSLACSVHALLIRSGFDRDAKIAASLVNLYSKCKDLTSAREVFDLVNEKSVFLWTSMIGGYVQSGQSIEALDLFQRLLNSTMKPNEVTIATILSACADIGSLGIGRKVEDYIRSNGLDTDLRVQTSLIHMYCKCGCIERAKEIFDGVSSKDTAVWSAMINGYACHGRGEEALMLFKLMEKEETISPDAVVFTDILSACSHSGLVEEGLKCFHSMQKDYGIEPSMEHYSCVIDLLGRAGHIDSALKFIHRLPVQVQNHAWQPLLSASRAYPNVQFGDLVAKELHEMRPQTTGNYVLMANMHASLGKWKEATSFRRLMDKRGLVKKAGWSRLELHT